MNKITGIGRNKIELWKSEDIEFDKIIEGKIK